MRKLVLVFVATGLLIIACRTKPSEYRAGKVRVLRDLGYVAGGHKRNKLDIYLPEPAKVAMPLPLIVWVHGGAWLEGSKEDCPAVRFTRKGYAVASINYRLSQHEIFPAQIEDCKAAVRWLRANSDKYGLDAERFGVLRIGGYGFLAQAGVIVMLGMHISGHQCL